MVTIGGVGDVMTGISLPWRYKCLSYEHTNAFRVSQSPYDVLEGDVRDALTAPDVLIANLEAPITDTFYTNSFPNEPPKNLTCPPETVELLQDAGVDVVTLANNHILDHGPEAVEETKAALHAAGIEFIGDPLNDENPLTIEKETPVHCVGYNLCDKGATDEVNEMYRMAERLGEKSGVSCILIHWGRGHEHTLTPSPRQIEIGQTLVEKGIDVVLGHHPHTFQPVEMYEDGVICYSLGNFIFDMWMTNNVESGIVEIDTGTEAVDVDVTTTTNEKGRVSCEPIERIVDNVPADVDGTQSAEDYDKQAKSMKRRYRIGVFGEYIRNIHRFPPQNTVATFRRWGSKISPL